MLPLPWTPQKHLTDKEKAFQATLAVVRSCMTFWWKGDEFPMSEVSSSSASAAMTEMRQAWSKVHERRKSGLPARVRYRRGEDPVSLQTCSGTSVPRPAVRAVRGDFAGVKLPAVFGGSWKVRYHRPIPEGATVNLIRVKRSMGGGFEVILTVTTDCYRRPAAKPGTVAGADRGVNLQIALSDGRYALTPGLTAAEREKYRELERQLTRQRRKAKTEHPARCSRENCRSKWHPSKNYLKTQAALRRLLDTASCRMTDHMHKLTRRVADEYETVVFEDLNLAGMTMSARGTAEEPGRNVAAKSGLNRELLAANLGAIPVLAAQKGVRVKTVSPVNTSRMCPECGHTNPANRLGTRFLCTACGRAADADINAAINICERLDAASATGTHSQADRSDKFEKECQDLLIPASWGRPTSRERLSIRRSAARK